MRVFICEAHGKDDDEDDLINHAKVCGGAVASAPGRVKCVCGREYSQGYFRKHRGECDIWKNAHPEPEVDPVPRAPRVACDACGRWMRKDNLARHKREACPGGEAGP